jgi:hypothetical protein
MTMSEAGMRLWPVDAGPRRFEPVTSPSRSMAGYLVMPRPKDLIKGLLIPVTFLLGVASVAEMTAQSWVRATVVLLVVELLIYPARYQWNDMRGFVADQQHPSCASRGRLPGPLSCARSRVYTSGSVAVLKVADAGLLCLALPGLHLGGIVTFAAVGVFAVAIAYEALRSGSTGHTGEVPPPVNVGILLLWITVGAGYVVRGITGLALAVGLVDRPVLAIAAVVTLWAYGVAFVTSRWAMESLAFAKSDGGSLRWTAKAGQAREHLLALARWLPTSLQPDLKIGDWAPLQERNPLTAPWNIAMVVAGTAAALTGRLLCGPCTFSEGAATAVAGGVLTVVVVSSSRWRGGLVLLGAAVMFVVMALTSAPGPALGVAPWLLVLGAYLFFSSRTLSKLAGTGPVARVVVACLAPLGRLTLGGPTWSAIHEDDGAGENAVYRRA